MKSAIYAGSFDILTFGHANIIEKACLMFEEVHVLIANNPDKNYIFTPEERLEMFNKYFNTVSDNLRVSIWDKLVIDYAFHRESPVLIRGIRNTTDMLEEMKLADVNKEIGGVGTVFPPCDNKYRNVSSSLVRELIKYGKDVKTFVPPDVEKALKLKFSRKE